VIYQGTLKWNQGVHNEMVYFTGNIPSGTYDPHRLANLSLGFVAFDAGDRMGHLRDLARAAGVRSLEAHFAKILTEMSARGHSRPRQPVLRAS
jgi:hypothetical protein